MAGLLWDLYRLDLATLAWEEIPSAGEAARAGQPRILFGMAPAGDWLFVFGGTLSMAASPLKLVKTDAFDDLYQVTFQGGIQRFRFALQHPRQLDSVWMSVYKTGTPFLDNVDIMSVLSTSLLGFSLLNISLIFVTWSIQQTAFICDRQSETQTQSYSSSFLSASNARRVDY